MSVSGVGEIADLASNVFSTVVSRVWPDKSEQEKQEIANAFATAQAQIAANIAEASQPGFHFRDGAGWVCVFAMFSDFVLRPLVLWGSHLAGSTVDFPALDVTILGQMLFALLGLGAMHMNEQVKGTK